MKVYKVKVNGKVYEVELESVSENNESIKTAPVETKTEAAAPATSATTGGEVVKAPMQGTILKVNVNVNDKVEKGQVLMILEAMKLENEILAPVSGVVKSINVNKGQTVNSGQDLLTIG